MGIKKHPLRVRWKMGLSRMLKMNPPFIKIFLYVKLVSGHGVHLLELPGVEIPKFPKWGLGEYSENQRAKLAL